MALIINWVSSLMAKFSLKAVGIGLAVFTILFCTIGLINMQLSLRTGQSVLIAWVNISGLMVYILPGFIGGRLAGKWGFLHGAVIGLFATLVTVVLYSIKAHHAYPGFVENWGVWFLFGAVTCGIGGVLWDIYAFARKFISKKK